jgi:ppGpp synthetase/RelA/SpoT-type nucleotidyltranferase
MRRRNPKEHYTKADYPAIFGDTDSDTIEDVDDPHPYTPGDTHSIEEVRLADEVEALLFAREEFIPVARDMKAKLGALGISGAQIKSRVKTPFSILNKLRRKRLQTLTDVAGAMIIVPDQKALEKAKAGIERDFEIVGTEDYYSHPQNGYRAMHYIVRQDGHPVELQLKTRRMAAISKASHTPYKRGQLDPVAMEELTYAAWQADKGNKEVARWLDPLLEDLSEVRRRLTRKTNPRYDCRLMPEDPWSYFTRPPGTVLVALDDLRPTRAKTTGIKNAERYMREACAGKYTKRAPITVDRDTMKILDGNSTYAVAKAWGWEQIPVVFDPAAQRNPRRSRVAMLAERLLKSI